MSSLLFSYIRIFHLMCRFIGLIFMYVFEKRRVLKRVILFLYNIFIRIWARTHPGKFASLHLMLNFFWIIWYPIGSEEDQKDLTKQRERGGRRRWFSTQQCCKHRVRHQRSSSLVHIHVMLSFEQAHGTLAPCWVSTSLSALSDGRAGSPGPIALRAALRAALTLSVLVGPHLDFPPGML